MNASTKFFSSTRIAVLAVFTALAGVLQCFSFAMPVLFAPWLELNFADVPTLIGTYALGPVSGCIIVVGRVLIRILVRGTSTAFVGDLADVLIGIAFVLPVGLIYKKNRTLKGAAIAIGVGTVCTTLAAMIANLLVLVPFYVDLFFKGDFGAIVGWFSSTVPAVTEESFYGIYLFASVLPFNVLRCLVAVLITMPVYKSISRLLNTISDRVESKHKGDSPEQAKKRTAVWVVVFAAVAAAVITLALLRGFKVI